jgi:hypothetical protein
VEPNVLSAVASEPAVVSLTTKHEWQHKRPQPGERRVDGDAVEAETWAMREKVAPARPASARVAARGVK